jgi:hypothetical protein
MPEILNLKLIEGFVFRILNLFSVLKRNTIRTSVREGSKVLECGLS